MLKNQKLSAFILILLVVILCCEVISIVILSLSYYFLQQMSLGYEIGENFFVFIEQYGDSFDRLYILLSLVLGISFLFWTYKAHSNLSILGATNLRYSDASCVWWFFVPIANLWKPYSALKETLKVTQNSVPAQHNISSSLGTILLFWWLIQFPAYILASVINKLPEPNSLDGFYSLIKIELAYYSMEIILSILLFYFIYKVNQLQKIAFSNIQSPKVSLQKS